MLLILFTIARGLRRKQIAVCPPTTESVRCRCWGCQGPSQDTPRYVSCDIFLHKRHLEKLHFESAKTNNTSKAFGELLGCSICRSVAQRLSASKSRSSFSSMFVSRRDMRCCSSSTEPSLARVSSSADSTRNTQQNTCRTYVIIICSSLLLPKLQLVRAVTGSRPKASLTPSVELT